MTAVAAGLVVAVLAAGGFLVGLADDSGTQVTTSAPRLAEPVPAVAEPGAAAVEPAPAEPLAPLPADASSSGSGLGAPAGAGLRRVEPSRSASSGQDLPDTFRAASNSAGGYAVGVPIAFDVSVDGPVTYVEWDDATFRPAFEVRSYEAVDPSRRLRQDAKTFAAEHEADGYRRIGPTRRWVWQGLPAVAWEWTWTMNGELMHGREIAFRSGPRTYTVLYRSADLWWLSGGSSTWPQRFEQAFVTSD